MDRETPYSPDEQRVCDYLQEITNNQVGCGDDPVGFLIASHAALRHELNALRKDQKGYFPKEWAPELWDGSKNDTSD